MALFKKFLRCDRGAAAIEMSLGTPLILAFFFGMIQIALLFWAQASLANAVGEAARFSTIYPTPTDADIENFARNSDLGIDRDMISEVTVTRGADAGHSYVEIDIVYKSQTNFIFFSGPAVTLSENRRAYTS